MDIRQGIKKLLKNEHITQKQLADKLGFKSQSTIAESLRRNLTTGMLIKILEVTDYELVLRPKSGLNKSERTIIIDGSDEE